MANGGVVGVAVSVVNQLENYKNIVKSGLGVGIGERDEEGAWNFNEALILRLIVDIEFRMSFFQKTQKMIRTHGAKNVISAILEIHS